MRHRVFGKKLGRSVGQRNALRRTMITQLFTYERIKTTRAKAEAIRGAAEHMITQAKNSLKHPDPNRKIATIRLLNGRLDGKAAVQKVFDELAPRYENRPGGYTRIFKLGPRKGDAAEMVILELVDRPKKTDGEGQGAVAQTVNRARGLLGRFRRRGQAGESAAEETKPEGDEGEARN